MVTEKASQYCCFHQRDGRFLTVDDKRNSEVCGNNKKRNIIDGENKTENDKRTGSIGGWLKVALYSVVQPDRPLRKKMKQKQTTQKETRS